MARYEIDEGASRLVARTKAKGLLAKVAHDLEIAATPLRGSVDVDGEAFSGKILVRASAFEVVGVLRGGRVDRSVLSDKDRAEIERRIRDEVMGRAPAVTIDVRGSSRARAEAKVGWTRSADVAFPIHVDATPSGGFRVTGAATVSMKSLGAPPVEGPLGAFRVDDAVDIHFAIELQPA